MAEKTSKKQQDKVIKEIIEDLQASDDKIVMDALARTKEKGDVRTVGPLITLFENTENEEIAASVKKMLSEIKISESKNAMVRSLGASQPETQEMLLFALWNANLNPIEYIDKICLAACKGNYMIALEALTVIENLEGPFDEEVLAESKLVLNEYFAQPDEKEDLIKEILQVILSYDNFLQA